MSVYYNIYIDHCDTKSVRAKPNESLVPAWDENETDMSAEPEDLVVLYKPDVLKTEEYDALLNIVDKQYVRVRSIDFTEIL